MKDADFILWNDLNPEIQNTFKKHSKKIELKRGDFIYKTGDIPLGMYFIQSGLVGLVLIGSNSGKQHLMRFFKEGQFFGHRSLFSNEKYHGETVALEPTSLIFVPKEIVMSSLQKYPDQYLNIIHVLAKELRRSEENQIRILENQIIPRVCQSIVYLKDLHPNHNWTRQEIADFCASTVSTVIKALAEIEEMGLIKQSGRSIEIIDRNRLISFQDEF